MLGNRHDSALCLASLMICVVFFSVACFSLRMILATDRISAYLYSISPMLASIITAVGSLLLLVFAVFLVSPLRQAARSFFVACALNRRKNLFKWFSLRLTLKTVRLSAALFLIKTGLLAAWLALPLICSTVLAALLKSSSVDSRIAIAAAVLTAVLFVISLFFYALNVQDYICAHYILVSSPNTSVRRAIFLSRARVRDSRLALLRFRLSFLPWFLLCVAIVPLFYVWPYYKQSLACYILIE